MASPVNAFTSPPSVVDEVTRVLTERIIHGEFVAGARLVEDQLAKEFGISRAPIRESLRALAADGLVVITPRRGARVRAVAIEEVGEIYSCRAVLEGLAARDAARIIDRTTLMRLRRVSDEMQDAAMAGDLDRYFNVNVTFHVELGRAASNTTLERLIESLGKRVLRMRYASLSLPGRMMRSAELHRELMKALEDRDAQSAGRLSELIVFEAAAALKEDLLRHGGEGSSVEAVAT